MRARRIHIIEARRIYAKVTRDRVSNNTNRNNTRTRIMARLILLLTLFCGGCVTTTKTSMYCNKTIDLENDPMSGTMNIGIRLELFRDWSRK